MDRVRHFGRWLPNGGLRWAQIPTLVILAVVFLTDQHPVAVMLLLVVPVLAWIGFTRHERSVATWKRA